MRKTTPGVICGCICTFLATSVLVGAQGLSANDSLRLHTMLRDASEAVKKNYYDSTYHGLNWDARFREYDDRLKSAPSLNRGTKRAR